MCFGDINNNAARLAESLPGVQTWTLMDDYVLDCFSELSTDDKPSAAQAPSQGPPSLELPPPSITASMDTSTPALKVEDDEDDEAEFAALLEELLRHPPVKTNADISLAMRPKVLPTQRYLPLEWHRANATKVSCFNDDDDDGDDDDEPDFAAMVELLTRPSPSPPNSSLAEAKRPSVLATPRYLPLEWQRASAANSCTSFGTETSHVAGPSPEGNKEGEEKLAPLFKSWLRPWPVKSWSDCVPNDDWCM